MNWILCCTRRGLLGALVLGLSWGVAAQVAEPSGGPAAASETSVSSLVSAVAAPVSPPAAAPAAPAPMTRPGLVPLDSINAADTAWMMTSTALVLLMTLPGIALFYGGMVRRKSVINTMACVAAIAGLVSVLWFALGYSLAFTRGSAWVGGMARAGFAGLDYLKEAAMVDVSHVAPNIP